MKPWIKLGTGLALVALVGCGDTTSGPMGLETPDQPDQPTAQNSHAPIVSEISPNPAHPGQLVTIAGSRFGSDPFRVNVTFNGIVAEVQTVSDNSMQVVVPLQLQAGEATVSIHVLVCGAVTTRMMIMAASTPTGNPPGGGGGPPDDEPGDGGGGDGSPPGGGDDGGVDDGDDGDDGDDDDGDDGDDDGDDDSDDGDQSSCGNRVLSVDVLTRTIRLADGGILTIQTDALIDASGDLTTIADVAAALAANADVVACVTTRIDLLGIVTVVTIRFDLENADQVNGEVASVDPLTGTIVLDSGTQVQLLADADISGDHGSLASIETALDQGAQIVVQAEGFLEDGILHATSVLCDES